MAEIITIGDSYYKEIEVTRTVDREKIPLDLTPFDDNYVAIKASRDTLDDEAYLFKPAPILGSPKEGRLLINLSPEETELLPITGSSEMPFIYMFVQIGSTITGRIHEVSALKTKTRQSGIRHKTKIDKSFDMGCINEVVGWRFDMGRLCEPAGLRVDLGSDGGFIYLDAGHINDTETEILDMGSINAVAFEKEDLGIFNSSCRYNESC